MKAYLIGGPQDMVVMFVKEDAQYVDFAHRPAMSVSGLDVLVSCHL
jgi:hypothetical protein